MKMEKFSFAVFSLLLLLLLPVKEFQNYPGVLNTRGKQLPFFKKTLKTGAFVIRNVPILSVPCIEKYSAAHYLTCSNCWVNLVKKNFVVILLNTVPSGRKEQSCILFYEFYLNVE